MIDVKKAILEFFYQLMYEIVGEFFEQMNKILVEGKYRLFFLDKIES